MSIAEDRLGEIEHAFFIDHDGAGRALQLLRKARKGKGKMSLARLLRHHEEKAISDRETWKRDHFDYLLAYCSMVEVACLAGYIPGDRVPERHLSRVRPFLNEQDVRRYYEDHYPLLLPQVHRLRLEGHPLFRPMESTPDEGVELFDEFFTISQPIETGDAMETFLWFLDGGSRGGVDIDNTLNVLRKPKRFLAHIDARPEDSGSEELDPLSASVQGCIAFLEFAPRFLSLLRRTARLPILQSAMWHYHGYWLGQLNHHMGGELRRAVAAIDAWDDELTSEERAGWAVRLAAARHVRTGQQLALGFLSSGRFSYTLIERFLSRTSGGSGGTPSPLAGNYSFTDPDFKLRLEKKDEGEATGMATAGDSE